jgi:hypothetical protein
VTTRLPPSKNPATSQASQQQRARRSIRPQAPEKPKPIKAGGAQEGGETLNSPEAQLWAGQDMDRSLEIRASDVENRMAELATAEQLDQEEGAEHAGELHEAASKDDKNKNGLLKMFSWKGNAKPAEPPAREAATATAGYEQAPRLQGAAGHHHRRQPRAQTHQHLAAQPHRRELVASAGRAKRSEGTALRGQRDQRAAA